MFVLATAESLHPHLFFIKIENRGSFQWPPGGVKEITKIYFRSDKPRSRASSFIFKVAFPLFLAPAGQSLTIDNLT